MNIWYKDTDDKDTKLFRVSPNNRGIKDNASGNHKTKGKNDKLLSILRLLTRTALPGVYILFCISFFLYGVIQG